MSQGGSNEVFSWRACLRILACILAVFVAVSFWSVLEEILFILLTGGAAIFVGMIIAYIVNIPMRYFERMLPPQKDGSPRSGLAMGLALFFTAGLGVLVLLLVIPQLVSCIIDLTQNAPTIISEILNNKFVASIVPQQIRATIINMNWGKLIGDAAKWLRSGIMQSIPEIASAIPQIGAIFMGFVFATMFLGEKRKLGSQIHRLIRALFGSKADQRFSETLALFDECFSRYFIAQGLAAFTMGVLTFVTMLIFGLPYADGISALVGVFTFVPIVGPLIAMVLGTLLILPSSWMQAFIFLAINFTLQQVQNMVIVPRFINRYVQLDGMWTLVGITLGCAFGGIPGAFVGVPLLAAVKRIIAAYLRRHEELIDTGEEGSILKDAVKGALDKMKDAQETTA